MTSSTRPLISELWQYNVSVYIYIYGPTGLFSAAVFLIVSNPKAPILLMVGLRRLYEVEAVFWIAGPY